MIFSKQFREAKLIYLSTLTPLEIKALLIKYEFLLDPTPISQLEAQ